MSYSFCLGFQKVTTAADLISTKTRGTFLWQTTSPDTQTVCSKTTQVALNILQDGWQFINTLHLKTDCVWGESLHRYMPGKANILDFGFWLLLRQIYVSFRIQCLFSQEVLVQNNQIASKSFQTEFSKALTLRHVYYSILLNNAQIFPETYSNFLTAFKNLSGRRKSSVFDSLTRLVMPLTACNYN